MGLVGAEPVGLSVQEDSPGAIEAPVWRGPEEKGRVEQRRMEQEQLIHRGWQAKPM